MLHSGRDNGNSHANIPVHTGAPGGQQDGLPAPHHQRQDHPVRTRVQHSLLEQEDLGPVPAVPARQRDQQPLLHTAQGTPCAVLCYPSPVFTSFLHDICLVLR